MQLRLWASALVLIAILVGCSSEAGPLSVTVSGASPTSVMPGPTVTPATVAAIKTAVSAAVTQSVVETPSPTARPDNTPTPTETPMPTETPTPTPTASPSPSSTPTPQAVLRQLTSDGCCVRPYFSPDSARVLFIDKPSETVPSGVYGLDLTTFESPAKTPPQLIYETLGFRSPDHTVVAFPDPNDGQLMRFLNEKAGETWTVNTLGNWPLFSKDGQSVLWNAIDRRGPYDERPTDIWVSRVDGSDARRLLTIYGGSANGWFPDNEQILITGRAEKIGQDETMVVFSLADGSMVELARENRLRGGLISPGGSWVVYLTTFTGDVERDGLWVVRSDGSERRKLPFFGPYYWLDDDHLTYIPTRNSPGEEFALWKINVVTGEEVRLTDPKTLPISIEGGDWALSPDGNKVVYVSAIDQNLWLVVLPEMNTN